MTLRETRGGQPGPAAARDGLRGAVSLTGALALTLPFSRNSWLGLLMAGEALLADTAALTGTRCGAV